MSATDTLSGPPRPRRFGGRTLAGAAAVFAVVAIAAVAFTGRGFGAGSEDVGAGAGQQAPGAGGARAARTAATTRPGSARGLVADPEAAQSAPLPAGTPQHAAAITPAQAALATTVSPGAPSDEQVRAELRQLEAAKQAASGRPGAISAAGIVTPPLDAPAAITRVIAGANAIATFPYVYGGGHASFIDTAYDCSGSVSYALAAAGLVAAPLTSGDFERWGAAGAGRHLTVYANAGHMFMTLDGLRYDTSGRSGVFATRWQTAQRSLAGFLVRHWPGL